MLYIVVKGFCSAVVLAALLVNESLLTASLSTVLAFNQTLSPSSAEFWPLELCTSLLCLVDSKTWNLNLPGNLGRVSSSEVSDLRYLIKKPKALRRLTVLPMCSSTTFSLIPMIRMLSMRTVLQVPLLNVPEQQDEDGWANSGEKGCPAGISGWHSAETVCDTTKVKQKEILFITGTVHT